MSKLIFRAAEPVKAKGSNDGLHLRYMYTGRDFMAKPKMVLINNDGCVVSVNGKKIEPTPLEDYGDYHLSEKLVSNALDRWDKKVDAQSKEITCGG